MTKIEIMPLGISKPSELEQTDLGINLVTAMKVTGIVFSYNHEIALNRNFRGTLINIDKMLNIWKMRHLSLLGKIQIIKTFGISQILFVSSMLYFPKELIPETNKLFYKFVWNNTDEVKRETLARMPDLQSILDTQKAILGKRFLQQKLPSLEGIYQS